MDQDGQDISEIILPQLNVSRRTANGQLNPYEVVNQQVIWATSAGVKTSYAYEKLLETFMDSIIEPKNNFVLGLDYRIPVMHGLISRDFVNKLKLSSTYNDMTFAAEYLGSWVGGSTESWFSLDKLIKYRRIKNAEWVNKANSTNKSWYLISVDVGRISDQTVVCVFKISEKNNVFYTSLVYLEVLGRTPETKIFSRQASDLKEIIKRYSPREVVIDTNGLTKTSSLKTLLIAGKSKLQYAA